MIPPEPAVDQDCNWVRFDAIGNPQVAQLIRNGIAVIEDDPVSALPRAGLGMIYHANEHFDAAQIAYRQALRDLPSLETPIWSEQPQVKIVKGKNIRTELNDTKADLQTTKEDLQSKATLEDLQTVKTQLQTTNEQNQKIEARIAFLETALISR